MVWVFHVLPATTKYNWLECSTWQQGQVGDQSIVVTGSFLTHRAVGLKPEARVSVYFFFLNTNFVSQDFSGNTCWGTKSNGGIWSPYFWGLFFVVWSSMPTRLAAINIWNRYQSLECSEDPPVSVSDFPSFFTFSTMWDCETSKQTQVSLASVIKMRFVHIVYIHSSSTKDRNGSKFNLIVVFICIFNPNHFF